jgi:hypothetical protein
MVAAASPKLLNLRAPSDTTCGRIAASWTQCGATMGPMAAAIGARRLAHDLVEGPAECSQAGEGDIETDIGDAAVGLAQEEHGALHPSPLQVAVRRFAEHVAEAATEVRRRDVGDRRDGADVERLGVCAVHRITGAQQASVEILGPAAHPGKARRCGAILQIPQGDGTPRQVLDVRIAKAAAHRLGLSHSTVKNHLANARSKVGVATTALLVWNLAPRLPEPEGMAQTDE